MTVPPYGSRSAGGSESKGSGSDGLRPGDAGYDDARTVWNGRFDSRPDLIRRATAPSDVADALRSARAEGIPITVKSGGHDYAGHSACAGGLLIDLSQMDSISVDAAARRARAGAGVRWGAFDEATQAHGLATPGGTVSTVGVAGFTLGGGEGWLSRRFGLACDNLVGAEVVTADGQVIRADENENADLFWALRGGGGNFGIVTSFEYRLHPLDHDVLSGQLVYRAERAAELLRFYRDRFHDAPDEAVCFPFFYRVPPVEPFPEDWHGEVVLAFVPAFMGPVERGEAWLAPFRGLAEPALDWLAPQPYLALQRSFDAGMGIAGNRWYTRAHYLDELTDAAIDALVGAIDPLPGDFTTVYLGPGGGAVGRKAADATAYPHRAAAFGLHVFPGWTDPASDDEIMTWARAVSDAIAPHASGGVYVNLLGEDEPDRVRDAYGPNHERLVALKRRWDPDNLFRRNHNISPGR